jgi:hypothetical protein
MSVYKDLEKRKLYQKIWAREKVLKKRAIEIVPESVVESVVEIIIPSIVESEVESNNAEVNFYLQFYRMRDLRKKHNLTDFAYWMMKNRRVNNEFLETYKNNFIPVEIVEPIVEIAESIVEIAEPIVEIIVASHFNCEECEFKMKRTEYNRHHTKCIGCFYPNRNRGKCLIILD